MAAFLSIILKNICAYMADLRFYQGVANPLLGCADDRFGKRLLKARPTADESPE